MDERSTSETFGNPDTCRNSKRLKKICECRRMDAPGGFEEASMIRKIDRPWRFSEFASNNASARGK